MIFPSVGISQRELVVWTQWHQFHSIWLSIFGFLGNNFTEHSIFYSSRGPNTALNRKSIKCTRCYCLLFVQLLSIFDVENQFSLVWYSNILIFNFHFVWLLQSVSKLCISTPCRPMRRATIQEILFPIQFSSNIHFIFGANRFESFSRLSLLTCILWLWHVLFRWRQPTFSHLDHVHIFYTSCERIGTAGCRTAIASNETKPIIAWYVQTNNYFLLSAFFFVGFSVFLFFFPCETE